MDVHKKLIHHAAWRWWTVIEKLGLSMEFEDVVQEAYLVSLNAQRQFDVEKGWTFSTYFMTAARNHFRELIKRMRRVSAISVEQDDETSLLDTLSDESQCPDREVQVSKDMQQRLAQMSPLSRLVVDLLLSPPPELAAQFDALDAKRHHMRKLGTGERFPLDMNAGFVCDLVRQMGASHADVAIVRRELQELETEYAV